MIPKHSEVYYCGVVADFEETAGPEGFAAMVEVLCNLNRYGS